jgi:hypothetical protein
MNVMNYRQLSKTYLITKLSSDPSTSRVLTFKVSPPLSGDATLTTRALKDMGFRELFNPACSFQGESCFRSSRESGLCHLDLAGSRFLLAGPLSNGLYVSS